MIMEPENVSFLFKPTITCIFILLKIKSQEKKKKSKRGGENSNTEQNIGLRWFYGHLLFHRDSYNIGSSSFNSLEVR